MVASDWHGVAGMPVAGLGGLDRAASSQSRETFNLEYLILIDSLEWR
jgi:hypothetical protein